MKMFLKKTPLTRMIIFLAGDMILLSLFLYLSFLFRFDWNVPAHTDGMWGVHVIVEDLQPSLKYFGSNVGHQYDSEWLTSTTWM